MTRLARIEIAEDGQPEPTPEMDQERRVAVFDLEESNSFRLVNGPDGPYVLVLSMNDNRADFTLTTCARGERMRFGVAMGPLQPAIRDYLTLCESYVEAVKTLPPARIEVIDAARRDIHSEAARQLRRLLASHAELDEPTARGFFTLLCTMMRAV